MLLSKHVRFASKHFLKSSQFTPPITLTRWTSCIPISSFPDRKVKSTSRYFSKDSNSTQKTTLIIGSSGSLGSTIASHLKSHHNCTVIGSDIYPPSADRVKSIDAFIQLSNDNISIDTLIDGLNDGLHNVFNGIENNENDIELDAIICANGGFAMDYDVLNNNDNDSSCGKVYDNMFQMNYYPVVAGGEIAKRYMTTTSDGLFVAFGAMAALSPAPGMFAYASSKVATHYYVQTLGAMTGKGLRKQFKIQRNSDMGIKMRQEGEYLDSMSVLGILPIMLDTQSNREALPNEDFSNWTKTIDIAKEVGFWIETPGLRPHSGSLVKAMTKDSKTDFLLAR